MVGRGVSKEVHRRGGLYSPFLLLLLSSFVVATIWASPNRAVARRKHYWGSGSRDNSGFIEKYIPTKARAVRSWVGSPVHQLLLSWGPPTKEFSDGAGGKIFVYSSRVPPPPVYNISLTEKHSFYVNSKGIIYKAVPRFGIYNTKTGEEIYSPMVPK